MNHSPLSNTKRTRFAYGILCLVLCLSTFGLGLWLSPQRLGYAPVAAKDSVPTVTTPKPTEASSTDASALMDTLTSTLQLIADEGLYTVDLTLAKSAITKALLSSTEDPYAAWLDLEESQALRDQIANNYAGMGFDTQVEDNVLYVANVLQNSAAHKAGLLPGDALVAINGIPLKGSNALFEAAKALDTETPDLSIRRPGKGELSLTLKTAPYHEPDVTYQHLDKNTAYIDINTFSEATASALKKALEQAKADGVKGIIFDVRYNLGGYMAACYESISLLTDKAVIAYETTTKESIPVSRSAEQVVDLPYVVMINRETYSAAELFAQALAAHAGAGLIGETTHGKGLQQTLFTAEDGTLKLSTAYFSATPDAVFQGVGVEPQNIYVESFKNYQKDHFLEAAKRFLIRGLSP